MNVCRRPQWNRGMTPEDLATAEHSAFLAWRRELVTVEEQEKLLVTPFEKNIDIWRQLWRVVERSDALVQIVDARCSTLSPNLTCKRDPLFFASEDLIRYVGESGAHKRCFLLINKADFLNESQRLFWAKYLRSQVKL